MTIQPSRGGGPKVPAAVNISPKRELKTEDSKHRVGGIAHKKIDDFQDSVQVKQDTQFIVSSAVVNNEALSKIIREALDSASPNSLSELVKTVVELAHENNVPETDIAELVESFAGIHKVAEEKIAAASLIGTQTLQPPVEGKKEAAPAPRGVLGTVADSSGVVYQLTMLSRNILKVIGLIAKNMGILQFVERLGALRVVDLFAETGHLVMNARRFFSLSLSPEQRISTVLDLMLNTCEIVDIMTSLLEVSIKALGHLSKDMAGLIGRSPALAQFLIAGAYMAVVATMATITKNILDLVFTSRLIKELEADINANEDYAKIREKWNEKIEGYHWTINKLLKVCKPDVLKVLKDFEKELRKYSHLETDVIESEPVTSASIDQLEEGFSVQEKDPVRNRTYDQATNERLRKALLGRVKSKVAVQAGNTAANVAILAAEFLPTIATTVIAAGIALAPATAGTSMLVVAVVSASVITAATIAKMGMSRHDALAKKKLEDKIGRVFEKKMKVMQEDYERIHNILAKPIPSAGLALE